MVELTIEERIAARLEGRRLATFRNVVGEIPETVEILQELESYYQVRLWGTGRVWWAVRKEVTEW